MNITYVYDIQNIDHLANSRQTIINIKASCKEAQYRVINAY